MQTINEAFTNRNVFQTNKWDGKMFHFVGKYKKKPAVWNK